MRIYRDLKIQLLFLLVMALAVYPEITVGQTGELRVYKPSVLYASEAPIYVDDGGARFTTTFYVNFNERIVRSAGASALPDQLLTKNQNIEIATLFSSLKSEYGDFTLTKVYPNDSWGNNFVRSKRTGKMNPIPELSQYVKIEFATSVNEKEVVVALRSLGSVKSVSGPMEVERTEYLGKNNSEEFMPSFKESALISSQNMLTAPDDWLYTNGPQ